MIEILQHRTEDILSLLDNVGYFLINERNKHQYKTYIKDDNSLVTDLDIASELLIKDGLKSLFGNIAVLSEENDENDNINIATSNEYFFLLDPLDGTTSFTNNGEFTINLAFCIHNKPVFCFIHSPTRKTVLFGDTNNVFVRTNGLIKKLPKLKNNHIVSQPSMMNENNINIACGSGFYNNHCKQIISFLQQRKYHINETNIIVAPALNKIFEFAMHNCDACIFSNICKDWDILPALPILDAIGAIYIISHNNVFADKNFNQPIFCVAKNDVILEDLQSFLYACHDK